MFELETLMDWQLPIPFQVGLADKMYNTKFYVELLKNIFSCWSLPSRICVALNPGSNTRVSPGFALWLCVGLSDEIQFDKVWYFVIRWTSWQGLFPQCLDTRRTYIDKSIQKLGVIGVTLKVFVQKSIDACLQQNTVIHSYQTNVILFVPALLSTSSTWTIHDIISNKEKRLKLWKKDLFAISTRGETMFCLTNSTHHPKIFASFKFSSVCWPWSVKSLKVWGTIRPRLSFPSETLYWIHWKSKQENSLAIKFLSKMNWNYSRQVIVDRWDVSVIPVVSQGVDDI